MAMREQRQVGIRMSCPQRCHRRGCQDQITDVSKLHEKYALWHAHGSHPSRDADAGFIIAKSACLVHFRERR